MTELRLVYDVNGAVVYRANHYETYFGNPNNPYYLYRLVSKYRYSATLYEKLRCLLSYAHRNISYHRVGIGGYWANLTIITHRVYAMYPSHDYEYYEFYNNSRFKISHFINN